MKKQFFSDESTAQEIIESPFEGDLISYQSICELEH